MRLDDGHGTTLDLDIIGYQFAPSEGINSPSLDYSDCNWLMVRGRILSPKKSWEFTDPCLTTQELENLACWFGTIAILPIPHMISFMEPNLRLTFAPLPHPTIKITLSNECSSTPDGLEHESFPGFDELIFPMNLNDPALIAKELGDLATMFPPRNPGKST
jgi:hypothetical protein